MCPRCHGPLTDGDDQGGASRAVPERDIDVCGPCATDEAAGQSAGLGIVLMAEWPVCEPHMSWGDIATR